MISENHRSEFKGTLGENWLKTTPELLSLCAVSLGSYSLTSVFFLIELGEVGNFMLSCKCGDIRLYRNSHELINLVWH